MCVCADQMCEGYKGVKLAAAPTAVCGQYGGVAAGSAPSLACKAQISRKQILYQTTRPAEGEAQLLYERCNVQGQGLNLKSKVYLGTCCCLVVGWWLSTLDTRFKL